MSPASLRILFAAAVAAASGAAVAAVPGGLPDALKSIKPAGEACYRDDAAASAPVGNARRVEAAVDMSCAIGVGELLSLRAREPLAIVDIRNREAFVRAAIEGSLNMSATELRSKGFLRDRHVVLVGDGKGQRDVLAACSALKSQGFAKSRVLIGGLPAWVAAGQPVAGRADDGGAAPRLSSEELWMEGQFEANIVVLQSEAMRPLQQHVPVGVVVSDLDPGTLKKLMERRRPSKVASVVIASPTDLPSAFVARLREQLHPIPLLLYVGSAEAFARDMKRLSASWAAQARGPKQPSCGL